MEEIINMALEGVGPQRKHSINEFRAKLDEFHKTVRDSAYKRGLKDGKPERVRITR